MADSQADEGAGLRPDTVATAPVVVIWCCQPCFAMAVAEELNFGRDAARPHVAGTQWH